MHTPLIISTHTFLTKQNRAIRLSKPAFLPRRAAERVAKIQRWTRMPAGGHFAAAEEPELVANDVAEFFRTYR